MLIIFKSNYCYFTTVMLSPRGQAGLEAKILSLALASKICPRPRPRPRTIAACPRTFHSVLGKMCAKVIMKSNNFDFLVTLCSKGLT